MSVVNGNSGDVRIHVQVEFGTQQILFGSRNHPGQEFRLGPEIRRLRSKSKEGKRRGCLDANRYKLVRERGRGMNS